MNPVNFSKIKTPDTKYTKNLGFSSDEFAKGYKVLGKPEFGSAPADDSGQDDRRWNGNDSKPKGPGYLGKSLETNNISKEGVGPEQDVKSDGRGPATHSAPKAERQQVAGRKGNQA